jgi:hypothetical protein
LPLAGTASGFWLKTLDGYRSQISDSMPKKLFLPQPFAWYIVDAAYDINRSSYDLTIHQNGLTKPVVALRQKQTGAAAQFAGRMVDRYRMLGIEPSSWMERSVTPRSCRPISARRYGGDQHVLVDNAALQLCSLSDHDTLEEERILCHGALFYTNVPE